MHELGPNHGSKDSVDLQHQPAIQIPFSKDSKDSNADKERKIDQEKVVKLFNDALNLSLAQNTRNRDNQPLKKEAKRK